MEIDLAMCFRCIIAGNIIAIIVLLLPLGNAIIATLIVKGLCTTIYIVSDKEEIVLLCCTLISVLLYNTIKEVIDPAMSGNEDITGIYLGSYRWECLEISVLQQIRDLLETKINGIFIGLVIGFIVLSILRINTPSIQITILVLPVLIYRICIRNKNTDIVKVKEIAYLIIIALTVKVLTAFNYSEALLICLYVFFYIPAIFLSLKEKTNSK